MITFYQNTEAERERIAPAIENYGHTSDHNLDWWACAIITREGVPVFAAWPDGMGILAHRYPCMWRIWSDPLCTAEEMAQRVGEFAEKVFRDPAVAALWCDDISDAVYPALQQRGTLKLDDIFYSLKWLVMDMAAYDPALPGGRYRELRNARNKFYREHAVEIIDAGTANKKGLQRIVDEWKKLCSEPRKEDVYDLRYRLAIERGFRGFTTARVFVVDGVPRGVNAGYEVPNKPKRFAGIVGIHDYSLKDLGTGLWLEDLEWIKRAGYRELDMQGSEHEQDIKAKSQYGRVAVERTTDTFLIRR